jgi:tRNA pseudouridine55 synthase
MATGKLIVLIGDECKNKQEYLNLDKTYEVSILFGVSTDSYDLLGIPKLGRVMLVEPNTIDWKKYVGEFEQPYPPYSSKTVLGVRLHTLARENSLPTEMPTKKVSIYNIKVLEGEKISASDLLQKYVRDIDLVKGDFRQSEIRLAWQKLLSNHNVDFSVAKIEVECSSGTYMRSLAHEVGKDLGTGAIALSIRRTRIYGRGEGGAIKS